MAISIMMLRCFAAVAQSGTLADAGLRLGRTPSAISMTLKQLEDHLGAPLFESERKNRLTALGEEIFEMAQQQLHQFDEATGAMETAANAPKGLLRIAAVPSVAFQGLPKALDQLMKRHPTVQVDIQDADTDIVIANLLRGQIDMGIVSGTPSLNGVRRHLLFEDAFGLVCARTHPLMVQDAAPGFTDLRPDLFVRNNLCASIGADDLQPSLSQARVTARNTLSLISMLKTGRWVTLLPRTVIGILPDHLAFRTIDGLSEMRPVSLLVRERCLFPELAAELGDILTQLDWQGFLPSA